jgi:hypothetical protein
VSDAKSKIEEIEARRAARKAEIATAREEQYALDLEALDGLEVEHGDGAIARLDVERFVSGHPTFIVMKAPSGIQYKRFCDQVAQATKKQDPKGRRDAENLLGASCWVYPAEEEKRKAMLDAFPGLLLSIAIKAAQLVEAREAKEGEG